MPPTTSPGISNAAEVFSAADLDKFVAAGQVERKDESKNHHPIFDKENSAEISLLDGIETAPISEGATMVEEPQK